MSLLRITFLFFALVPVSVGGLVAQTGTAFKTGERTTSMTKQCFYDYIGNGYTRTVGAVELCPLTIQVRVTRPPPKPTPPPQPTPEIVTAFKTGERTTSMTKQCFYDYIGNGYTRTVGAIELCPLTIQVRIRMR